MSSKRPKQKDRSGVDRAGRTPLHYAAAEGDVTLVEELLKSGANPAVADDNGWTPLHFAAKNYKPEVVRALLAAGAPVDSRDLHGNTPLSKAVFSSEGRGEIIRMLRSSNADPYADNLHGVSPVQLSRTIANFDVKQFFGDLPETPS
jgi:ankyrin repeat protein